MTVHPRFEVNWREPFSLSMLSDVRPAGQTIAEIVASVPGLPDDFAERGTVLIGEDLIPRALWPRVRPRGGDVVPVPVSLFYPMRGGKGGGGAGKQILGAVASIGLILATSGAAAGAFATAGGLFAAGSTSAKVLSAGIGIAGSLLISALTPPPVAPKQPDERKQRFAGFGGNVLEPGGIVPSVIGEMRVDPPAACRPLIELVGDDRETAEIVLIYDGPLEWSDIRVDDVDVDRIEELNYQTRPGLPPDTATTLVQRYGRQDNVSLELTGFRVDEEDGDLLENQTTPADASPIWHALATRRGCDEFWISLACPQGIYDASGGASSAKPVVMPIRLRFRERGSGTWINCPEFHILSRQGDPSKYCIKFIWQAAPALIRPRPDRGFAQCFVAVGSAWAADSYFYTGSGDEWLDPSNWDDTTGVRRVILDQHQALIYLDPATYGQDEPYEIEIKKGSIERIGGGDPGDIASNSDYAASGYDGAGDDLFDYWTDGSDKKAPRDQLDLYQTIGIERIASVWNTHPITTPGEWAVISLKVKGRVLGTVSAVVKGIVDDLDGGVWDNPVTTSNPAPWMRDIFRGKRNPKKVPTALVDNAGLASWRTRCNSRGYTCDMEVKGQSVAEVARLVASCGYAQTYWNDLWGVVEDKDRSGDSITSLFSPRDIADWNMEKNVDDLPDHYIVKFLNRADDYRPDEVIVYAQGNTEETTNLPEVLEYIGLVEEEKAVARAEFDDAVARQRMTRYSFKTGRKALSKRRGDLIAVGHDSFDHAIGFGRITRVIYDESGDNVLAAALDAEIPIDVDNPATETTPVSSGDDLGLPPSATASTDVDETTLLIDQKYMRCTIEFRDGTVVEREFMPSGYDVIEFDEPIPDIEPSSQDPDPWVGAHVTTGTVQRGDHKRMIVMSVLPEDGRFAATITAVDEAPDLPFPNFS